MVLSVKVGQFTEAAAGSTAVTGVGFTPKALLAWQVDATDAASDAFGAHIRQTIGFATRRGGTTQQKCLWIRNDDNVSAGNTDTRWVNALLAGELAFPRLTLTTFDEDGFTVAHTVGASHTIGYMAIGGSDVTDACVVEDDWPTSGATFDVIGAGFTPDCGIFLTGALTGTAEGASQNNMLMGLGCFAGAAQWSMSLAATDGDTMTSAMNWNSVFSADSCITLMGDNADTVDAKGIFSAFTSDGATITNTNAPTAALRVFALYLQGGQYKAGSKAKTSSAAAESYTFNTPTFVPKGVLLGQAVGTVSNTVIAGTAEWTLGGGSKTDGTEEGYIGGTSIEAINTQADEIMSNTRAIAELTPGAAAAVDAEADLTALASGSFDLTWANAGTAALVGFLAMGSTPVASSPPPRLFTRTHRYGSPRRVAV